MATQEKNEIRLFQLLHRLIAFDLYKKILTNPNIRKSTIIIYTLITNEFTKIQNEAKKEFNFKHFYDKAPSLFNARAIEFFYEMLANYGIKEVNYYSIRDKFMGILL